MARLAKYRYPWPWRDHRDERGKRIQRGQFISQTDYLKELDAERMALLNLLNASERVPPNEVVNVVVSFPRGDGQAYYIVTKERPLTLQWIPYGDAWTVEPALIRGLTKKDILAMRQRDRAMTEMFGGGA